VPSIVSETPSQVLSSPEPTTTKNSDLGLSTDLQPIISPENANQLTSHKELRFDPWKLVMAVAWSPSGELMAVSAGDDIYLVRASDWGIAAWMNSGSFTHGLAFSPDGRSLASASRDGFLRLWGVPQDQATVGEPLQPRLAILAHRKGANSVAYSPDGLALATGGNDAVARFWDPGNGEELGVMIGGTFAVPAISFSPQGGVLAVVNGDVIRLREIGSERIVGTLLAETPLFSLAYSPLGSLLAVGDIDNTIRLWDPELAFRTGQEKYPEAIVLSAHNGRPGTFRALIWHLAFSPDGGLLASAGGDSTIRLWSIRDQSLLATLRAHTSGVTGVAFSPDGRWLASGSLDGTLQVWGARR
jgi:WD40 repeat protein